MAVALKYLSNFWRTLEIPLISTTNHMSERTIWDILPECIFKNFEIARMKEGNFKIFKNYESDLSQKSLNETCDYWLITPNLQTLCIGTNIF